MEKKVKPWSNYYQKLFSGASEYASHRLSKNQNEQV